MAAETSKKSRIALKWRKIAFENEIKQQPLSMHSLVQQLTMFARIPPEGTDEGPNKMLAATPTPPSPAPTPKLSTASASGSSRPSSSTAGPKTPSKMAAALAGSSSGGATVGFNTKTLSAVKNLSMKAANSTAGQKKSTGDAPKKKVVANFAKPEGGNNLAKRLISGAKQQQAQQEEMDDDDKDEESDTGEEYSLQNQLVPALYEVSRQKLRSLRMALRKFPTSSENSHLLAKDVQQIFVELKIHLPSRVLYMLLKECENRLGETDHEKLLTYLHKAHQSSGRDSVEALVTEDMDMSDQAHVEEQDKDLVRRAEDQMTRAREAFDVEEFKQELKAEDVDRKGILPKALITEKCNEHNCPVYGALLTTLLKRSDQEKNDMISWPEFVNFLERTQKEVIAKHPELSKLQKRTKKVVKPVATREMMKARIMAVARKAKTKMINEAKAEMGLPAGEGNAPTSSEKSSEPSKEGEEDAIPTIKVNSESRPTTAQSVAPNKEASSTKAPVSKGKRGLLAAAKVAQVEKKGILGFGSKKSTAAGRKAEAAAKSAQQAKEAADAAAAAEKAKEAARPKSPVANPNQLKMVACGQQKEVWISDAVRRTGTAAISTDLPTESLELQWVYGYRGNDCRNNIFTLSSGEVVYFVGHAAVVYLLSSHTQRHYKEHTADIRSIGVHSEGIIVATGQGPSVDHTISGSIRVWRSDTLLTLCVLGEGTFLFPITRLVFCKFKRPPVYKEDTHEEMDSPTDRILALEDSFERTISFWDVKKVACLAKVVVSRETICDIDLNPKQENMLITIGKEHISWWEYIPRDGEILLKAVADHQGFLKAKVTVCLLHNDRGDMITGDSNGTIYVWGSCGNVITNYIKHAHEETVFCICFYNQYLFTGSRGGNICLWLYCKTMDKIGEVSIPEAEGGIRSIKVAPNNVLLVGTTSNSLLCAQLNVEENAYPLDGVFFAEGSSLTQGHFDQLETLASIPGQSSLFMTAGYDGQICVYDTDKLLGLQKTSIKKTVLTAAYWSMKNQIVIGTKTGECIILEQQDLELVEVFRQTIAEETKIQSMAITIDNQFILLGCENGSLYILTYEPAKSEEEVDKWTPFAVKTKMKGVHSLQLSNEEVNSSWLAWVGNKSAECRILDLTKKKIIADHEKYRQVEWNNQDALFSPSLSGAWGASIANNDTITCASVNPKIPVLAVATQGGKLGVFKYPCIQKEAYCHTSVGSKPFRKILFTDNGKYLITVGGAGACTMQWLLK